MVLETISDLRNPEGVVLEKDKAELVYKLCFQYGGSDYKGADSHVPSVFLELYRDYLVAQEKYSKPGHGKRVLVVNEHQLNSDCAIHPGRFSRFREWHSENRCELLQTDPDGAKELMNQYGLWTTDLGIWPDKYALLFKPENSGEYIRLSIVVKGEQTFQSCIEYFDDIYEKSNHFMTDGNRVQLLPKTSGIPTILLEEPRGESGFNRELCAHWEEFVNCPKRLEKLGPFLLDHLSPYKKGKILDAATGIGCESIFLLKNGFAITSNEIDKDLARIAFANSLDETLPAPMIFSHHNWKTIDKTYEGLPFDVALLLGNSLCLILDARTRNECIANLAKVLRQGGIIVIDERNFQYMLDHQKDILDHAKFPYKGTVIYCGEACKGYPFHWKDKETIVFEYVHDTFGRVGTLEMHAFKRGELKNLLETNGFEVTEMFEDLESNYRDSRPPDFITYIARKK